MRLEASEPRNVKAPAISSTVGLLEKRIPFVPGLFIHLCVLELSEERVNK
jgi:hypothetical protein